jgi:hypothetical protein
VRLDPCIADQAQSVAGGPALGIVVDDHVHGLSPALRAKSALCKSACRIGGESKSLLDGA